MDIQKSNRNTFDIYGTEWEIKYCDNIKEEANDGNKLEGLCDHSNHLISIATKKLNGEVKPQSEIELTKLHEIFHAILGTGQYIPSCEDEPLVEWLARSVYSLKKQGIL